MFNTLDCHDDERPVNMNFPMRPWGGWCSRVGPNRDRARLIYFNAWGERITSDEFRILDEAWNNEHAELDLLKR